MKKYFFPFAIFAAFATLNSCIKQSYNTPPDTAQLDPGYHTTLTVKQLDSIAFSKSSGGFVLLGNDTISGYVVADDRTGNFYKQIVIQQDTAGIDANGGISSGITVDIAQDYLYTDYPIGRKIYIALNGLYLVNYKGLPTIAYAITPTGSLNGIPSQLALNCVVKASFPHTIVPIEVRLSQVLNSSNYMNMLVKVDNVQFLTADTGIIYAQPAALAVATSLGVEDCSLPGATMVVYNSAYATWASALTQPGNGSITGIYSYYGSGAQFLLRDTSEVKLNGPRVCP